MIEYVVIALISAFLLILGILYIRLYLRIERRAHQLHEQWRTTEMDLIAGERAKNLFEEWKRTEEKTIRKDAITRSEAVVRGKITEHLIPYFPSFRYDPRDARFLGTPVDFIIFNGLSSGDLKEIIFVEVKSGKHASLSQRERQVRDCVEEIKIRYELLRHEGERT